MRGLTEIQSPSTLPPEPPTEEDSENVSNYIESCNTALVDFELEIKITRDQNSGTPIYTFVNLHSTPSTMPATLLSDTDITFVRNIIEFIFGDAAAKEPANTRFYITAAAATSEAYPKDRNGRATVGRSQVIEKLNGLVDGQWLVRHPRGEHWYALSNRALAELGQYINDNYEETAAHCDTCGDLFTVGLACECGNLYVHHSCRNAYTSLKGAPCHKCGRDLGSAIEVGFSG